MFDQCEPVIKAGKTLVIGHLHELVIQYTCQHYVMSHPSSMLYCRYSAQHGQPICYFLNTFAASMTKRRSYVYSEIIASLNIFHKINLHLTCSSLSCLQEYTLIIHKYSFILYLHAIKFILQGREIYEQETLKCK